jgi:serine protease Do/serine protease DegQ
MMPRRSVSGWLLALLLLTIGMAAAPLQAALPSMVEGQPLPSLAPVLEHATPAVVNISTTRIQKIRDNPLLSDPFFRRFFDIPDQPRQRRQHNLGSGVVVDAAEGLVVTNNHVIQGADKITVTLRDGRRLDANLIGVDPDTDVAMLRIPAENLAALPMANSDNLRVGDFVIAIGNPFGLGQTVTSGIVSALGRSGLGIEGYEDFIQTDASINPGNSGGALINLRGELVGINTAIYAPSGGNIGIGFAIPINMARSIMQQLIEHGRVHRGRLGAQAQDLTVDLAKAFAIKDRSKGAVVVQVDKDSPAAQAGLKVGDIVTAVNDKPIESADDLRNVIGLMRVGDSVRLVVQRQGQTLTLNTRVAETNLRTIGGETLHPRLEGLELSNIPESSPYYGRIKGVMISDIRQASPANRSQLRKGDIITSVNRHQVTSTEDVLRYAKRNGGQLLLNIQRGNGTLFLMFQ